MRIIQKAYFRNDVSYNLLITLEGGQQLMYDCDEHGTVDTSRTSDMSKQSLANAKAACSQEQILKFEHTGKVPAIGKCDCGTVVHLGGFTNTCRGCEADYNWNGSRLASREFWGEETGEHLSDILMIP